MIIKHKIYTDETTMIKEFSYRGMIVFMGVPCGKNKQNIYT